MKVVRILVFGDFHHPTRARISREEILKLQFLEPNIVVGTGDYVTEEVVEWIEELGGEKYLVEGNMDEVDLPKVESFEVCGWKFVVWHGSGVHPRGDPQKLLKFLQDMGGDVLLTGHTHRAFLLNIGGKLIINPGSFTGVYSGESGPSLPSYAVLDVEKDGIRVMFHFSKRQL